MSSPEITVIANLALDRVNGSAWRAGGCPTFAPFVFAKLNATGAIVASCADGDRGYFEALRHNPSLHCSFVTATSTSQFALDYAGDDRSMRVFAIGHEWTTDDIASLEIETEWVHLAPLLRTDFPTATVAALAAQGHRVSYDGQGLVRAPYIGELRLDARYEASMLRHLTVLKVSEDEARVLGEGRDPTEALAAFAEVPELLLTEGSHGSEVCASGSVCHVSPTQVIEDVQATGAGDAFMMAYLIGRHRGDDPFEAAGLASDVTAAMLAERKARMPPQRPAHT